MILKQKKYKLDKLKNSLKSESFLIFQLGNINVKSKLEIQKLFLKYELKSTKVKNKIFQKLFFPNIEISKFSQSSLILVENVRSDIYKSFLLKLDKMQTGLILIGAKDKNNYYLPNKVMKIFTTLEPRTVEENLNLNLTNPCRTLYIYLKAQNKKNEIVQ